MPEIKEKTKYGYLFIAIIMIAIGLSFILLKDTLKTLSIVIGIIVALSGAIFGIITLAEKKRGFGFVTKISLSVIVLICGVATAIMNQKTVATIVNISCLLLIIDGAFKLNTAVMSKRYSVKAWWVTVITAIPLIAGAFYLLKYTPETIRTVSIFLAMLLFIDAINNLLSMFYVKAYETRQKTELYYELFREKMETDGDI